MKRQASRTYDSQVYQPTFPVSLTRCRWRPYQMKGLRLTTALSKSQTRWANRVDSSFSNQAGVQVG